MNIKDYMKDNTVILDGSMGTQLASYGIKPGELPESWNLLHPEIIEAVHTSYYEAGSNIVYMNTFGINSLKYEKDEAAAMIRAAFDNASRARDKSGGSHAKYIALDIGPLGHLLKPFGDLDFEDAVDAFAHIVRAGSSSGADLIVIETMNDSYETKAAVLAAKENSSLPVFVTNAYGTDGRLITGADAQTMVCLLEGLGVDATGLNCSFGPDHMLPIADEYLKYSSLPVIFKPNAGMPEYKNGRTLYNVDEDEFAGCVRTALAHGVRLIGGCCGTTPEYIRRLAEAVKDIPPVPVSKKEFTAVTSYTHAVTIGTSPVIIGERINPTGKKRLRQALIEHDMDHIVSEAIKQEEAGAHILDVNAGTPEIDEKALFPEIIKEIQAVTDLPVNLDTSDPEALEAGLRVCNGKALVNSVNGKKESMDAVFPVVKKYGGTVIALTLDENGIPETPEGRLEIAERIIKRAAGFGIDKKDLIFDPLTMTISTSDEAARITLRSLKLITEKTGCGTVLGVSNVSFGLPGRDMINALFLSEAIQAGLSAAIINPLSVIMMQSYFASCALAGYDSSCLKYIEHAASLRSDAFSSEPDRTTQTAAADDTDRSPSFSLLSQSILKGLKAEASAVTKELLKTHDPLNVINKAIIPALDSAGEQFEAKKLYLPQLLMCAETAKVSFEEIKKAGTGSNPDKISNAPVILATVKGDIHDIGKNIVKLLLENYGFNVMDLGKDVPPEIIVEKAVSESAPLVGLSALMTTTLPSMEQTVYLLRKKAPDTRIMVGGAVLTKEYADSIGADFYGKDAMESVRFASEVLK